MALEYNFNEKDARTFYILLGHSPQEYTELRVIDPKNGSVPGRAWVNNEKDFLDFCRKWNGKAHVYAGLNPRPNQKSSKQEQIKRVTLVPLDIDPERPKDSASTEKELQKAKIDAQKVLEFFKENRFTAPYVAMSGNGIHIILSVDIEVKKYEEIREQIRIFFTKLPVSVDEANCDLTRIFKVPGTWSLKGDNTKERPHRQATIIQKGDMAPDARFQKYVLSITREKGSGVHYREVGGIIPEGKRNSELLSLAGSMRRRGMDYDEILAAIITVNDKRCNPPLEDREVQSIVKSVSQYDPQEAVKVVESTPEMQKSQVLIDDLKETDQLLFQYGYEIKKTSDNQFIIVDYAGKPKLNFKNCSEATGRRIKKHFPELPEKTISEQLAILSTTPILDAKKDGKESHATKIVGYALEAKIEVFKDQFNSPFVRLPEKVKIFDQKGDTKDTKDGNFDINYLNDSSVVVDENINVRNSNNEISVPSVLSVPSNHDILTTRNLTSRGVNAWLGNLLYKKEGIAPSREATKAAVNIFIAMANESVNRHLYNRIAPDGKNGIYLDISDPLWRVIHITWKGWKIVDKPPILFKRFPHQMPLFKPIKYGDPTRIFDIINVSGLGQQLLYLASIVSTLVPEIPHVIIVVWGEAGTGKTWVLKVPKLLIDNSGTELLSMPKNDRELIQNLDHHYLSYFDNVSDLDIGQSDIFCRGTTGLGFSKRLLYSDDEDILKRFKRCIGMNGLNVPIAQGDFFDRSVIFECDRISANERITDKEMQHQIENLGPIILGGILDVISKAIKIFPSIQLETYSRMADFMAWGCAISEALGIDKEHFLKAYKANIEIHSIQAIKSNVVGDILLRVLDNTERTKLDYTPTELFNTLKTQAKHSDIDLKDFPKNATHLGRELNKISSTFPSVGWEIIRPKGRSKGRKISIQKIDLTKIDVMAKVAKDSDNWGFGKDLRAYYDPQAWELQRWRDFLKEVMP